MMTNESYYMPERADIDGLSVGDMAPDCFGRMAEVTEIFARSTDVRGKVFVCYYTKTGPTSSCSMSMKEGVLVRHAGLRETSAELDRIEASMRAGGAP